MDRGLVPQGGTDFALGTRLAMTTLLTILLRRETGIAESIKENLPKSKRGDGFSPLADDICAQIFDLGVGILLLGDEVGERT